MQERQNLVQLEIKCTEEETRKIKMIELGSQEAWLRWDTEQTHLPGQTYGGNHNSNSNSF